MSNTQQQAYLANGASAINSITPADEYIRGIDLTEPKPTITHTDLWMKFGIWIGL